MKYGFKEREKERFRGCRLKRRKRKSKAARQNFDKIVFAVFPELSENRGAVYAGLLQLAHHIIG